MRCYPYRCVCGNEFDVYKNLSDIDKIEICQECGHNCTKDNRVIARTTFYGADDWNSAEYNPAFGKHVTKREARLEAKRRGMEEVGNEDLKKYHKHIDQENEKRRKARWDKV